MEQGIMKKLLYLLSSLLLIEVITNCGGNEPDEPKKTEAELRTVILTSGTGNWAPSASAPITVGGVNMSTLFEDFTIKFTEGSYTSTGTTPVWARAGTWKFKDDTGTTLVREDGLEVQVSDITETAVKFTLEWAETTREDGRSKSLAGTHVFTLSK